MNHNKRRRLHVTFVAVTSVFGLMACQEHVTPTSQVAALTKEQLAGATYSGIYDDPVTLTGGEYLGDTFVAGGASRPRVQLVGNFLLHADLTGDGKEEAVVLLAESSGGSGTFTYIAVMGLQGGGVVNIGTAPLGDRVQIRDSHIDNGVISIDVVQAGQDDAACCPTEKATRVWKLDGGGLVELAEQVTGGVSVSDLEGVEWLLRQFGSGDDAPNEPEITLILDDGRVSGHSGCNRYMGHVNTKDGGSVMGFGPLAGTMMACPQDLMALEQRYLKALAGVRRFSFLTGQLALTSVDEDGQVSILIFEGRTPGM
jgi:heat shock protein HslJ